MAWCPCPWPQACLIMLYSVIVMGLSTLLKMLMIDPPSPAGNPGMSLIKLFLAGRVSGISGFPGIFCSGFTQFFVLDKGF